MRALKDDTLYKTSGGEFKNGAGQWVFSGQTGGSLVRRGLYAFDVAGQVPAGVTITGASLTLNMSRSLAGDIDIGLHQVLTDWQEGVGQGSGNEGAGISAVSGDVTWTDSILGSQLWDEAGGDFTSDASATAVVGEIGSYTWSSTSALVADVQSWLDNPDSNFGWLVLGDETGNRATKRFDSRKNESQ